MKKLAWIGSSKKDLMAFPKDVIQEIGYAIYQAQIGERYRKVKNLKGYGARVHEIVTEYDKNAYRVIYAIGLNNTVYVVHCFQKKSKHGIKTPREEMEVMRQRLRIVHK